MLKLAADENLSQRIVSGLRRRRSGLDLATVQSAGLAGAADPEVLTWAAEEDRVLVTHDTRTMTSHAYARVTAGQQMPGVVAVPSHLPLAQAIDELVLIAELAEPDELRDRVLRLPL